MFAYIPLTASLELSNDVGVSECINKGLGPGLRGDSSDGLHALARRIRGSARLTFLDLIAISKLQQTCLVRVVELTWVNLPLHRPCYRIAPFKLIIFPDGRKKGRRELVLTINLGQSTPTKPHPTKGRPTTTLTPSFASTTMRPSSLLSTLLLLPATLASASAASEPQQQPLTPESTHTLDLYTQPLGLSTSTPPAHLAKITYTYPSLNASLSSYTPPSSLSDVDSILKLGFYDPSTRAPENWHGIATSTSLFAASQKKTIKLHLDAEGKVWHIGFSASPKESQVSAKGKGKGVKASEDEVTEEIAVVLVPAAPGPKVQVNKPVVVNKETGKPEGEGEEKTFLQK